MKLREMIVDGRLAAGSAINEVHLAREMGVSRTPLREALSSLVSEGAIVQIPRRGFFVRELTIEEAQDIYMIRPVLDAEALRLSGLPSKEELQELQELTDALRKSTDVLESIRLDDEWFMAAWRNCPNQALIALIHQFMLKTRRYELAAMSQARIVASSSQSKQKIVDALRKGDLDEACRRMRLSLERGLIPVVEWLESR
ncbi:MAG: hypothetical protein QOJ65_1237 [Fimbriimonadaceae bacterium]|jgi:DNA-binding GntR family transcriptional regulator|nr:hypothetical protein [Fimbriimonadaceae bacterium]